MKTGTMLVVLGAALAASGALAQTYKTACTNTGASAGEPAGESQWLSVSTATCLNQDGPLQGAAVTHNDIWENNKGTLTMLSADGVIRKPGTLLAYRLTSGTGKVLMQDGKPAGWTASGTGVYTFATGEGAASFKGKQFTWTGRATGPMTYVIEMKLD